MPPTMPVEALVLRFRSARYCSHSALSRLGGGSRSWDAREHDPPRVPSAGRRGKRHHVGVAKYDPLLEHLCRAEDGPVEMTFEAIADLVGGLPASAERWPAWWANETAGSRHVQARAWLDSGREVEWVDRNAKRVIFSAAHWRRGS